MNADAYETVRSRWGWIRRSDRALFRVTGERAVDMLDGLVTNDLKSLGAGAAQWALFLTPKGRILADARILRGERDLWIDVPAAAAEAMEATFRRFLPPRFARAERLTAGGLVDVYGPDAPAAVAAATGVAAPEEGLRFTEVGEGEDVLRILRGNSLGMPGYAIFGSGSALERLVSALAATAAKTGGVAMDADLLEVLRVEAGWPWYGRDVTEENLVQETGWEERAVSFTKGCYVGQEVVIRVHHRGHPNRHLRGLVFHDEPAAPGTPLFAEGKPVGTVTSAVRSPRLGPIGLGYVRREIAPSSEVRLQEPGGRTAQVVALPFPR